MIVIYEDVFNTIHFDIYMFVTLSLKRNYFINADWP